MMLKAIQRNPWGALLLLLAGSLCLATPGWAQSEGGEKTTVQLRWLHQFQFAGYYAALENGYYREEGLDVTLVEGGPGRNPIEEVLSGRAQYGAASNELLLARLRGKPIKVLAVIFQQSPSVFVTRKISGINSPQDMSGHRVMMMPGMDDAELLAMFMKEGVNLERIHRLPTSFDIEDLINGKTDVFNAYLTNEPFYMEQRDMPATIIRPSTYGIHFYGDAVFTSDQEIKKHPERVKAFRAATLRGWQYAMDHPEEIIELILAKYSPKKTREHLRFEAQAMRGLLHFGLIQIGHMNPGRWQHMAETFAELGLVPKDYKLEGLTYDPTAHIDLTPFLWMGGIGGGIVLLAGLVAGTLVRLNLRLKREVGERARAEQRFATMAANVPGVIVQILQRADGSRGYSYISARAKEFFGVEAEEVIREDRLLNWHPDDRERIETQIAASNPAGAGYNLVGRIILPGGQEKWVNLTASPNPQPNGDILYDGFILDVTERKLAELEYLASERKIKAMSQAVDDALIMIDSQGKVLFWNPAAERLFGFAADEAMGMNFHEMATPEELKERMRRGMEAFARTGQGPVLGATTEIEAQDRYGRIFPVEVTLSAFQIDEEWFAVGTVRDISARKQAQEAVKESRQRLASIVDFLPDPVLVIDNLGKVVSWNRSMERLTGVRQEDILGQGGYEYALPFYGERRPVLVDLVNHWDEETAQKHPDIRMEGDCLVSQSYHPQLGKEGIYLVSTATLLYDAEGKVAGAIQSLSDITERKRAEALMVEKAVAEEAAARAEAAREEAEAARHLTEMAQEELKANVKEIERFNRLAMGRERRIIELKRQANTLAALANFQQPYADYAAESVEETQLLDATQEASEPLAAKLDLDRLNEVLAVDQFHSLLRNFCEASGIAAAIMDTQGKILAATCWQRVCTEFHRKNEIACARCLESDTQLSTQLKDGKPYAIYRCKNGLTDAASPIIIDGVHLANVFVGQFFTSPPDTAFFLNQALEVGFDANEYLAAVAEVPVIKEERLPSILGFLVGVARMVTDAFGERQRARRVEAMMARRAEESQRERAAALSLAEDAEEARAEIELYKGRLELLVEERTEDLKAAEERSRLLLHSVGEGIFGVDSQGKLTFINPAALAMLGFGEKEIMGRQVHALIHHTRPDGSPYPLQDCPMHASLTLGNHHDVVDEVLWRKDGSSFPVEYSSTPISKEGGLVGAVITFRDVSERRRAEQEMRQYMEDLERFNRLTVGREERMIELKKEINGLLENAGQGQKYKIVDEAELH